MQDLLLNVEVRVTARPVADKIVFPTRQPYEKNLFVVKQTGNKLYVGAKTDIATLVANAVNTIIRSWALSASAPAEVNVSTPSSVGTAINMKGNVHSHGVSTVVTFEYGTTPDLGTSIAATQSPVSTDAWLAVNKEVSALTAATAYYYRIKCVSGGVTVYSTIKKITTKAAGTTTTTTTTTTTAAPTTTTTTTTTAAPTTTTTTTTTAAPTTTTTTTTTAAPTTTTTTTAPTTTL